jgi:hypothetical protein
VLRISQFGTALSRKQLIQIGNSAKINILQTFPQCAYNLANQIGKNRFSLPPTTTLSIPPINPILHQFVYLTMVSDSATTVLHFGVGGNWDIELGQHPRYVFGFQQQVDTDMTEYVVTCGHVDKSLDGGHCCVLILTRQYRRQL